MFQKLQESIASLATPAYTTIRQWVLKLGLYKLNRPKDKSKSWFFIIDTSIQMGPQKCVVVLGIPKTDLRKNFSPTFEDAEPLVVRPLTSSPGEVINHILEEAAKKTGTPVAVISDEGNDLKKGIRLFSENHPETIHLFDISHKVDLCLRKELENDACWLQFKKSASESVQHLKLSSLAHLVPPRQRSKARMHSSFFLIQWGLHVLEYLNSEEAKKLSDEELSKIDWVKGYKFALPTYFRYILLCKKALSLVHRKGYYKGVAYEFSHQINGLRKGDKRDISFKNKLQAILQEEEQKVPAGESYLGSSEVIESLFGKFKAMENHYSSSGLTSLVLGIPALMGRVCNETIKNALEMISLENLLKWTEDNIGNSFLSKRRHAFSFGEKNGTSINLDLCDF